uniref:Uncharacterized protein n=1 Tax=viral metagenome TaxID=1070528 RepID=A0A6M3LCH5_9ZZZZ
MKLTCNACPDAVDLGPLYILCPIAPGFKTLRGSVCAFSLDNLRDMRTVARARVRTLEGLIEAHTLTSETVMHKDARDCFTCLHLQALTDDPNDPYSTLDCQLPDGCPHGTYECWAARV